MIEEMTEELTEEMTKESEKGMWRENETEEVREGDYKDAPAALAAGETSGLAGLGSGRSPCVPVESCRSRGERGLATLCAIFGRKRMQVAISRPWPIAFCDL
jgi:hypothetical protein